MAEAQVAAVVGEAIDSHTHAHGVEKDVAGFQNCIVKSHGAMGLRSAFRVVNIAVILATKEGSIARAKCSQTFGRIVIFQHGRCGDNFENRAGSQLGLNGAV